MAVWRFLMFSNVLMVSALIRSRVRWLGLRSGVSLSLSLVSISLLGVAFAQTPPLQHAGSSQYDNSGMTNGSGLPPDDTTDVAAAESPSTGGGNLTTEQAFRGAVNYVLDDEDPEPKFEYDKLFLSIVTKSFIAKSRNSKLVSTAGVLNELDVYPPQPEPPAPRLTPGGEPTLPIVQAAAGFIQTYAIATRVIVNTPAYLEGIRLRQELARRFRGEPADGPPPPIDEAEEVAQAGRRRSRRRRRRRRRLLEDADDESFIISKLNETLMDVVENPPPTSTDANIQNASATLQDWLELVRESDSSDIRDIPDFRVNRLVHDVRDLAKSGMWKTLLPLDMREMIDLKDDEVWAEEIRKQLRNTRPSFDAQLTLTIRPVHKPLAGALDMTAPVIGATGIRFLPPGLRKLFDGPLAAGADIVPYAYYDPFAIAGVDLLPEEATLIAKESGFRRVVEATQLQLACVLGVTFREQIRVNNGDIARRFFAGVT